MKQKTNAEEMRDLFESQKRAIQKLNELSAKIVRPNDSLSATAEVWTRGTSGGGVGDRNDTRGHFHYFTRRGSNGFYVAKNFFHIEIALDNLCYLEIVRTNDKNGQTVDKNGGTWKGLSREKKALQNWLNEPHKKTKIPNWAEILDNWNNENPGHHIKVLYNISEEPFDLDAVPEEQAGNPSVYPKITFA